MGNQHSDRVGVQEVSTFHIIDYPQGLKALAKEALIVPRWNAASLSFSRQVEQRDEQARRASSR